MKVPSLKIKCSKCGHTWIPRKKEIFRCPNCTNLLEKHPPKIVIEGDLENFDVIEKD